MDLYRSIWRFASFYELKRMIYASIITLLCNAFVVTSFIHRMPISYYVFGIGFQFLFGMMVRFSYRFVLLLRDTVQFGGEAGSENNVLLIGAGSAGRMILRDVNFVNGGAHGSAKVVAIIDDNPNKWGRYIEGVPIVGGRDEILATVEKYHISKIFLAIPRATAEQRKDIVNICNETGCEVKILPAMYQLVLGQLTVSSMKDVSVEDLLGREPIRADMTEVFNFIHDKIVLVTGGGGSIGSELCRQVAAHDP
jgi:FlaA1/EpsC-like NDP-sugar epimerase